MKFWLQIVFVQALILGCLTKVRGQNYPAPCPKPAFNNPGKFRIGNTGKAIDALNARFCVGDTIQLVDESGGSNIQYWFEFKGAAVPTTGGSTVTNWHYQTTDNYALIQQGSLNATGAYYCMSVEVLPVPKPEFTLKPCPGKQAAVRFVNAKYDEFLIDWGDGTPIQTFKPTDLPNHTYANVQTYSVKVTGRYVPGNCGEADTKTVTTIPTLFSTPKIDRLEVFNGASLSIEYKGVQGIDVKIYQKIGFGGSYAALTLPPSNGGGMFSQVISAVNTRSNVYCYKLSAEDACGTTQLNANTEEICSIPFDVTSGGTQNTLDWTPYQSATFRLYLITRDAAAVYKTIPTAATKQDIDPNVKCGEQHCYRLTVQTATATSVSEQRCVGTGANKLPALVNLLASVDKGKNSLTWETPTGQSQPKYRLYRADNPNTGFQAIIDTLSNRYIDPTANPSQRLYCYQVSYFDACKVESDKSAAVCPVFLSTQGPNLVWTSYIQFAGTTIYTLEELDASGNVLTSSPVNGNLFTPDLSDPTIKLLRYRIKATSSTGLVSYSNEIILTKEIKLYVPNAFSPNGDGLNDTFEAIGSFFGAFRMLIYDRWGSVVYETTDPQKGWDGTLNNAPLEQGVYVYRIEASEPEGKTFVKTGSVTLLR